MIDNELQPWLIEVNSSPAMDYSTPVTKRLVKMVMEDTVKVMVDSNKKKAKHGTGLFKCSYNLIVHWLIMDIDLPLSSEFTCWVQKLSLDKTIDYS
jgi:hypothetical protein